MDKNTQLSLQKTPENNAPLSLISKKNSAKKPWKFYIFPAFVLVIAIWYGGYFRLLATGTPMAPNTVLDPACAPTDTGCYVQITPVASSSTAGQVLSNDGTNTTWVNETGGIFPYAGQTIARANWTGVSGTTIGTATTTLSDFIKNVFFPNGISSYIIVATSTAATTYTAPGISFTLAAAGSNGPTCTGTTALTCEKINSTNVNLNPTITTTPGLATPNTLQHRWAVWSDGSTSTTATYGVKTTTSGNWNSALDTTVPGTSSSDPISNVGLKTGVSSSPFCGFTNTSSYTSISVSPCSLSLVTSGQTIHPATTVDSTGGGVSTTFFAQDTGNGGTTSASASISFASRYYIFLSNYDYYKNPSAKTAAQIGTDFYNLASTCASGTGCTTGFMTSTSTGLRTINFTNTGGNYMYYAFPSSFGTLTGSIQDCHGGSGCTALSDSGWVLGTSASGGSTTVSLTNSHGGYTENYNLYSYQWDGAATTLSTPTSDAWKVIFPF